MANKLSNEDFIKMLNEAGIYTIEQLQVAGHSHVHWDNLTNVPIEFGGENTFVHLNDTPANITANYKLVGNATGTGLIFIPDTQDGVDGTDGREVELQNNGIFIQWRYVDVPELGWTNLIEISLLKGDKGDIGDTGLTGEDGREIILYNNGTYLQWKLVGDAVYQNLVALIDIKGDKGDTGLTGSTGENGIDGADGTQFYLVDTIPLVTLGVDNDLVIDNSTWILYKKISGVWVSQGVIKGDKGDTGDTGLAGSDGVDGSSIYIVSTIPTGGANGDSAINKTNGNLWEKANDEWAIVGSLKGISGNDGTNGIDGADGDKYYTTSTTTIDISAYSINDNVTLTVDTGLSYSLNQLLVISSSTSLYFVGRIVSYNTDQLVVILTYKIGSTSSSSWEINLAGMAEAAIVEKWYTISATAGTGTVSSRTYTVPEGWTVGASNTISVIGLGNNTVDLTIKHDTGYSIVECIIFANDGNKYTKLLTPISYGSLYEDLTHNAIELSSFCTLTQSLIIYIKLL